MKITTINSDTLEKEIDIEQILKVGIKHESLNEYKEAIDCYQKIITIKPNHEEALIHLSSISIKLGQAEDALKPLTTLKNNNSKNSFVYNNLGNIYLIQGDHLKAIEEFNKSLSLNPDFCVAKYNLATSHLALKDYEKASFLFRNILNDKKDENKPLINKSLVSLAIAYANIFDWNNLKVCRAEIIRLINRDPGFAVNAGLDPQKALMLDLPFEVYKLVAIQYDNAQEKMVSKLSNKIKKRTITQKQKLHIGYLSPDFGEHPTGLLLNDLFSYHNRDQFEISAFSLFERNDNIQRTIKKSVDHFFDISKLSLNECLNTIDNKKVDILVDLGGYTKFARPSILCAKPAPLIAHWLGSPIGLWMKSIDYYITHPLHVPQELNSYFSEKIVYLKNTWIAIKPFTVEPSHVKTKRSDFGLSEDSFVFCSFHMPYRIHEEVVLSWFNILRSTSKSVLWLFSGGKTADNRILHLAESKGINKKRIVFKEQEWLTNRWFHRHADLWLDVFNNSGGTTAMICSWDGPPTLTLSGKLPQSRWSTMHNEIICHPELIANSEEEYINKAIAYAKKPDTIKSIRNSIFNNRERSLLFDQKKFIIDLENAYRFMWDEKSNTQ